MEPVDRGRNQQIDEVKGHVLEIFDDGEPCTPLPWYLLIVDYESSHGQKQLGNDIIGDA